MRLVGEKLRRSSKFQPFMDSLLDVINKFRREEETHITLDELEDCLISTVAIVGKYDGVIYDTFASRFLHNARNYFIDKSSSLLSHNDMLSCINDISSLQKKEYIFTIEQIPSRLSKQYSDIIAEILIIPKVSAICKKSTGLSQLLKLDYQHKEQLAIAYNFFHEVPQAFEEFNKIYQEIYRDMLIEALSVYKTTDPISYIEHVIEVVEHHNMLVKNFMRNDKMISESRIDTIHKAVSKTNESAPSEGLAYYLDKWLKATDSKENIKYRIDIGLNFLSLLKDKDIFIDYSYKSLLCTRLLEGKTTDNEYERYIVKKLQEQYNVSFGKSCYDLLDTFDSEVIESDTRGKEFKKAHPTSPNMNVVILNSTSFDDIENIPDPHQLIAIVKPYRDFYQTKFSGRNLSFLYFEGKITMDYLNTDFEFIVPPIVAAFLLAYKKDKTEMSIKEFLAMIGVKEDQQSSIGKKLSAYLHPLCIKKNSIPPPLNVVLKDPKKGIPMDAPIKLVKNYKCNSTHITFEPQTKKKKIVGKVPERLSEDRSNQMEAFIVRYCKARNRVTVNEIHSQTRSFIEKFDVQPEDVDKVILELCSRMYLELEEDKIHVKYLA